jgi:hypothetical protein
MAAAAAAGRPASSGKGVGPWEQRRRNARAASSARSEAGARRAARGARRRETNGSGEERKARRRNRSTEGDDQRWKRLAPTLAYTLLSLLLLFLAWLVFPSRLFLLSLPSLSSPSSFLSLSLSLSLFLFQPCKV